jgi:predicted TIM-barrel fold metal-dependent hydrolase
MTSAPAGFRYVDVHTHLHPEWLARAIRRWFAERSDWKLEQPTDPDLVAQYLRERDVERFVFFSYAHRAGLARELNAWLHAVAARLPAGLALGTVHPDDPDMLDLADQALDEYGFRGFKIHINVQRFHPDDPRMLPLYQRLVARKRLVLIHVGTAPWPNGFDGFPRFARVMERFPELTAIVAHMGLWESREFMDLLDRYPNLYLDTTMAFAPEGLRRVRDVRIDSDDLVRWQDRILFGSDFPNLPYPYETERDALWERDLPMAAYQKIFRDNAVRVFGL